MKINGNNIRPKDVIKYNNNIYITNKIQIVKPGKGGSFIQVKLKNIITGTKLNKRFRSNEIINRIRLIQYNCTFLFKKNNILFFLNIKDNTQIQVSSKIIGDQIKFLQNGISVIINFYKEKVINIKLPDQIILKIIETEPIIKNQTSTNSFKPAILENGIRITVPSFIKINEMIIVDTNTFIYLRKANK